MPGYAMQWIEIEGPFFDDPVGGAGYRLLFDDLKLTPSEQARTGVPLEIGPIAQRPAPARRADAASAAGAVGRAALAEARFAKRSTRSNPQHRGKMPSGSCDRS